MATNKEILLRIEKKLDLLMGTKVEKAIEKTAEQLEVKESKNYIIGYHVIGKSGTPVETDKAWLIKPELNSKKGTWLPKSMIQTISYPNHTRNDAINIIFLDKYAWKSEKMEYEVDLK